jgi:hypothetical protein
VRNAKSLVQVAIETRAGDGVCATSLVANQSQQHRYSHLFGFSHLVIPFGILFAMAQQPPTLLILGLSLSAMIMAAEAARMLAGNGTAAPPAFDHANQHAQDTAPPFRMGVTGVGPGGGKGGGIFGGGSTGAGTFCNTSTNTNPIIYHNNAIVLWNNPTVYLIW